ncbi:hypothetical protein HMPREF1574_00028, partial [Gardnerella pickettii JCP7659]
AHYAARNRRLALRSKRKGRSENASNNKIKAATKNPLRLLLLINLSKIFNNA